MAKVKYLDGDTSQYGYEFAGGKPVEVTDAKHLAKFAGNPFFEVAGATTEGLKAEHHGGGKFNITNGESVLAKGLSKADADAFNAMTPAEQAEYVKTNS
jgi:hypothetical protein